MPDREPRHTIGVVSRRTGLTIDLIRAWERRYQALAACARPTARALRRRGALHLETYADFRRELRRLRGPRREEGDGN